MQNFTIWDHESKPPSRWIRVTKRVARERYVAGEMVVFCPCNLWPFTRVSEGSTSVVVRRLGAITDHDAESNFDLNCWAFNTAHCNTRAGKYAAFYVQPQCTA